jgi:hypothetical protein
VLPVSKFCVEVPRLVGEQPVDGIADRIGDRLWIVGERRVDTSPGRRTRANGEPGSRKESLRDSRQGVFRCWMAILAQGVRFVRNHGLSRGSRPIAKR